MSVCQAQETSDCETVVSMFPLENLCVFDSPRGGSLCLVRPVVFSLRNVPKCPSADSSVCPWAAGKTRRP